MQLRRTPVPGQVALTGTEECAQQFVSACDLLQTLQFGVTGASAGVYTL